MTMLESIEYLFQKGIVDPVMYLFDPGRRIAWIYLLVAGILACGWYMIFLRLSLKDSLKEILRKEYWWSRSAKTDYWLFLICGVCKAVFVLPYLVTGNMLAYWLSMKLTEWTGPSALRIPAYAAIYLYPLVLFLVKDFFIYVTHYLLHRNRYLWEFHKVHHSADTMNPFTLYRMHPVEMVLQNLQGLLAFALVTEGFYYFNHTVLFQATILGVNAFSFVFFMAGANLRHSHVPLRYPKCLERIFMSPYQHQMHHDRKGKFCHSNYGSRLALWDYLFGTLHTSDELPLEKRRFGLPEKALHRPNHLWGNLVSPFVGCLRQLKRQFSL